MDKTLTITLAVLGGLVAVVKAAKTISDIINDGDDSGKKSKKKG